MLVLVPQKIDCATVLTCPSWETIESIDLWVEIYLSTLYILYRERGRERKRTEEKEGGKRGR